MDRLKKYTLKFKTISPVILSPRDNVAFYKDVDFDEKDLKDLPDSEKINIIYPFYRYSEYSSYKEDANYYIPGSSLKGAILSYKNPEDKLINKLMIDDVTIPKSIIFLTQLYKIQYLNEDSEKKPIYSIFFENVAVETIKSDVEFEVCLCAEEYLDELLSKATKNTDLCLQNYLFYLENKICIDNNKYDDLKERIVKIKANVKKVKEDCKSKCMLNLGGFKGVLRSLSKINLRKQEETEDLTNGIYIDPFSLLPYGLVEVIEVK